VVCAEAVARNSKLGWPTSAITDAASACNGLIVVSTFGGSAKALAALQQLMTATRAARRWSMTDLFEDRAAD
jgi:hypothetical protein